MKQATITSVQGAPDWSRLPVIAMDTVVRPTEADIKAFAQIGYDDTALYLHLWAEEDESQIRTEVTEPFGQPCEDSCLEFFFRPDPSEMRYFNFEYNLNCAPFVGVGSSIEDLVRLFPLNSGFNAKANRTENGWEVFYQVPYSFIRVFFPKFSPKPGDTMRANFYKCGDKTPVQHYYAWEMPPRRNHSFHCPECFGELVFA